MNQYFEQMVLSASPVEIVNLLFQRAIRLVRDARAHLLEGRILERTHSVSGVLAILLELMNSLDREAAPQLSGQLHDLYAYMQTRLNEGNLRQEEAPFSEVLMLLTTLGEGWEGILAEERKRHEQPRWAEVPAEDGVYSRYAVSA